MQRSNSTQFNLWVDNQSTSSTVRSSEIPPVRSSGLLRSVSDATILDVSRSYSDVIDRSKRDKKRYGDAVVHSIPAILLFCYFCLWIASSEFSGLQDRLFAKPSILHFVVPVSAPHVP